MIRNLILKVGMERLIMLYKGLMISSKIAAILAILFGFRVIGVYALIGISITLTIEVWGEYKTRKIRRQNTENSKRFEEEFGENSQYNFSAQEEHFSPEEKELEDIAAKILAGEFVSPQEIARISNIVTQRVMGKIENQETFVRNEANFVKEAISFCCSYAAGKHDLRFSDEQRSDAFLHVISVVDMQAMPSVEKMNAILNAIKAYFKDVFIIEIPDFIFDY